LSAFRLKLTHIISHRFEVIADYIYFLNWYEKRSFCIYDHEPPLRGNVCCAYYAPWSWKPRNFNGLPISHNDTFFAKYYGTMSTNRLKFGVFKGWAEISGRKGRPQPTIFARLTS